MITFYGISQYSATEYPKGTLIQKVAYENEYIIKKIQSGSDNYGNIYYDYIILNKNLEPQPITRNGWSFCRFTSNSAWRPSVISVNLRDPDNTGKSDFTYTNSKSAPSFGSVSNLGTYGLNTLFELFINASNYCNWIEFLRTRPEVILDEKYNQNQAVEIQQKDEIMKDVEIQSLKEELEKLKLENAALKAKLEQIGTIIGKANRVLQKPSKKSNKKN